MAAAVVGFVNEHLEFFQCLKRNHLDYMIIDFFDSHLTDGQDSIWEEKSFPRSALPTLRRIHPKFNQHSPLCLINLG